MKVIVSLLKAIEDAATASVPWTSISLEGYDREIIRGHLSLLVDRGLIASSKSSDVSLTWKGHDYLESWRNLQEFESDKREPFRQDGGTSQTDRPAH